MKTLVYIFLLIMFLPAHIMGQDINFFTATPDTVAIGKPFEVSFILENGKGQIETPEFFGLKVVGGPNQSSSIQIINGDMNQSLSLTYIVVAEDEGEWVIERAHVEIDGILYETLPKTIVANHTGPVNPPPAGKNSLDIFGEFDWGLKKSPQLSEKPKMSKKDSLLKKYKVKKF